jgi:hypothetical protein
MSIRNAIKNYVKEYYEISYDPKQKQIILHDEFEWSRQVKGQIDIGRVGRIKITLVWDKIEEVTGIQYHHKEFQSELSKLFFDIINEKKSKEFFNLLLVENIPVNLEFKDVIDEFPLLKD